MQVLYHNKYANKCKLGPARWRWLSLIDNEAYHTNLRLSCSRLVLEDQVQLAKLETWSMDVMLGRRRAGMTFVWGYCLPIWIEVMVVYYRIWSVYRCFNTKLIWHQRNICTRIKRSIYYKVFFCVWWIRESFPRIWFTMGCRVKSNVKINHFQSSHYLKFLNFNSNPSGIKLKFLFLILDQM